MKRNFIKLVQICTASFLLCTFVTARHDTQITNVKQQISPYTSPDNFILRFSSGSISSFLKNVFNLAIYPQEHLARNFSHVVQGISLAPQHDHPRRFIRKVLNLFALKLHDLYVNPYAFCSLLEKLIVYASPYTDPQKEKAHVVEMFVETIGTCLSEQFDQLRSDPEKTLDQLAHKLFDLSQLAESQDISVRELQHSIHYFLARGMSLLTWSPVDQEDAWHIMISLASRVEYCVAHNLIDSEMADDLYWLLIKQFSIFLSVAALELSSTFFEAASTSLNNSQEGFWNYEERELYITSKYDFLKKALMEAEATSKLRAMGYLAA